MMKKLAAVVVVCAISAAAHGQVLWSEIVSGDASDDPMAPSNAGAMVLGSPQEVIDKILYEHQLFGMTRFLIQFTVGTLPHSVVMKSIELFGTVVAPAVRKATASLSGARASKTRHVSSGSP